MPTYNRAGLITEAMDSVRRQAYRPVELIVVDDGSTDGTADVVEEWRRSHEEKNDFQIRYLYQDNAGPSSARNYGLIESQGEFIQFLDSDDLLHLLRFEKLAAVFQEPACDFIQTGFDGFCAKCGKIIEQHYGNPNEDSLILALKGRLWANTLRSAYRRSLAVATGPWNEQMTCFEDYEYVVRALAKSRKSIAIRDILASARRGGGMRVSDRLVTHTGRTFRIMCEEALCYGVRNRADIPIQAKQAFASRLYALGFRSNAKGWLDLGKRCGEVAENLDVEMDSLGKRRRMVWRLGKWGGIAYEILGLVKQQIMSKRQKWPAGHTCAKD
ncbi:MAG: glycosyltransferase [Desulfosalsimonadaceae bacterium]|nr:glycosyltransferase [Desulfosalsimonadaceae bacterium]